MTRVDEFLDLDHDFKALSPDKQIEIRGLIASSPEDFADYVRSSKTYQTAQSETQAEVESYFLSAPKPPSKVDEFLADPTPEKQTILDDLIRPFEMAAAATSESLAGVGQAGAELIGSEEYANIFKEMGQIDRDTLMKKRAEVTNPVYGLILDIGTTVIQQAPGMAATIYTGSAVPIMAQMFAAKFGSEYSQLRQANYDPVEAAGFATVLGAIEGALETIGAGAILKGGKGLAQKVLRVALAETKEEIFQNSADILSKELADTFFAGAESGRFEIRPDQSFGSAIKEILYSGLVAFGAGGVYGSVAHKVQRMQGYDDMELKSGAVVPVPESIPDNARAALKDFLDMRNVTTDPEYRVAVQDFIAATNMMEQFNQAKDEIAKEIVTTPTEKILEEQINAADERLVQEGDVSQYPQDDARRLSAETGVGVGLPEGGQVSDEAQTEEVAPSPAAPRGPIVSEQFMRVGLPQRMAKKALSLDQRVAIDPKHLQQIKGPEATIGLDGTIISIRMADGKEHADIRLDAGEVVRNVPKTALLPAGEAWKFDGTSRTPTSAGLIYWLRTMQEKLGGLLKSPTVKEALNRGALGLTAMRDGKGQIKLAWDIAGNEALAQRVIAHEIGEFVVALPIKTVEGNKGLSAIRQIYAFVKKRMSSDELFASLRKMIERRGMEDIRKRKIKYGKDFKTDDAYHTYLIRFIFGRELEKVSKLWNPAYDKAIHGKPNELIATAISVLINNPAGIDLRAIAPKFSALFDAWIQQNPAIAEAFQNFNDIIQYGNDPNNRLLEQVKMYRRTDQLEAARRLEKFSRENSWQARWDNARILTDDSFFALWRVLQEGEAGGKLDVGEWLRVRMAVQKWVRSPTEYERYGSLVMEALDKMKKAGIVHEQIDAYFENMHIHERQRTIGLLPQTMAEIKIFAREQILFEREQAQFGPLLPGDIARLVEVEAAKIAEETQIERKIALLNPMGNTVQQAEQNIAALKTQLGPEKAKALEDGRRAIADIRARLILAKLEEAGVLAPALMQAMKNNQDYVPFLVAQYFGRNSGGQAGQPIHAQLGTLNDIIRPTAALLYMDQKLMRWANLEMAKRAAVDALLQLKNDEIIQPMKRGPDGKFRDFSLNEAYRTLVVRRLLGGKLVTEGFRVDKNVAEGFHTDAQVYQFIDKINKTTGLAKAGQWARNIFVLYNPGWWGFNVPRDYLRSLSNIPSVITWRGKTLKNRNETFLIRHYAESLGTAYNIVTGKDMDNPEIAKFMANGYILANNAMDPDPESTLYDRQTKMLYRSRDAWKKNIRSFSDLFDYARYLKDKILTLFSDISRGTEILGKVAAARYMAKNFPDMPEELRLWYVQDAFGSPNFTVQGQINPLMSNIFLFANPMVQAWKADLQAIGFDRTVALKRAVMTVMSKAIMAAMAYGLFGQKWREWVEGISMYNLFNYNIIPLGVDENGERVYLRTPQDPTNQLLGGLLATVYMAATDPTVTVGDGLQQALRYVSDQTPSVNPFLLIPIPGTVSHDILTYAAGGNPYDFFRDEYAIDQTAQEARASDPGEARTQMLRFMWNKMGGMTLFKFPARGTEGVKSWIKKFGNWLPPIIQPIFDRFLKVESRGLDERNRRLLRLTKAGKAAESLQRRAIINDLVSDDHNSVVEYLHKVWNGDKLTQDQINAIATRPEIFQQKLKSQSAKAALKDADLRSIFNVAKSFEEKVILIKSWLERRNLALSPSDDIK